MKETHPGKVRAVCATVQGGHHDIVIRRRNVWRVRYQRRCIGRSDTLKETAVVNLRCGSIPPY